MSVPPELLYDIIAYTIADYIDRAITTPPTRDCLRIRNLLDEEKELREAEESKKALRQAPSSTSAFASGEDGAGEGADSEQHRDFNTTADDDVWPTYDLTNLSDFHYSSDADEEEEAEPCETWEAREAKEQLPENNIISLLYVSRLFRDTVSKILGDTLDVQDGDPGSPLKTLKVLRRIYRIAHAPTHPIYALHKASICNFEYMRDVRATRFLGAYAGVVSLAYLLTELLRRFASPDAEQHRPLFLSHASHLAGLFPIPHGAVSVRVEDRVAFYLVAFDTLFRLMSWFRKAEDSMTLLLWLRHWDDKEVADCEEQIKDLELAMDAFVKIDKELDAEVLAGPIVPYNWIHTLDIPRFLKSVGGVVGCAPERAEHPRLKRLWEITRLLFRKWCARTTASPFIMLP